MDVVETVCKVTRCPDPRGILEHGIFSAKTRTVAGRARQLVTLGKVWDPREKTELETYM